ncbi:MAG: nucleotide exchange factor GrpE [Planctomycetes bacterium]|nr:nucleotide exchange factor GrpE [Planctomycetota bacterium]
MTNPEQAPMDATAGDGTSPKSEPTIEIPTHERELARLKEERDQLEFQLKRTLADADNMRRRARQELEDGRRRVLEGIAQELLPVLDSFKAALQIWDDQGGRGDAAGVVEGVRMVRVLLSGALERHGLQEMAGAGVPFDPLRHEAVGTEPTPGIPAGQVLRVLQTGYQIGDKVIRHAKVIVTAAPPQTGS